jgi:hypothetical protein
MIDDDNLCPACDGSGGGGYPCECPSCGGSGQIRRRPSRRDEDGDEPDGWGDWTDNNAEVRW